MTYAQELLFIPILFPIISINRLYIIKNPDTFHNVLNIQTGNNHYVYRNQFLPMKVIC